MNGSDQEASSRLDSLLELIEQGRDKRCEALRQEAREKRDAVLTEAYRRARRQMHEAVEQERQQRNERLAAATAQLQTRRREHRHQTVKLLLHRGWDRLREVLLERWRNTDRRREWIEGVAEIALGKLPRQRWRIAHPGGWDSGEARSLRERATEHCGEAPTFEVDNEMTAGLRIHTDGACLDATPDGVLADRIAVESMLLAEIERLERSDGGSGETEG